MESPSEDSVTERVGRNRASDDWAARHARTGTQDRRAESRTVRSDGLKDGNGWDARHGHVRTLTER